MTSALSETPEAVRAALGDALRRRREAAGRTLSDVAAEAGCSPAHLSEVERGRKDVSTELLVAIVHALSARPSAVFAEVAARLGGEQRSGPWPVDARARLDMATAQLSREALRAVAEFSTFLATGGEPPPRRRIGFVAPGERR